MDSLFGRNLEDGSAAQALADFELTSDSLFQVDYIAPPVAISDLVTTLYHMRCDESVIRDIQPASIGHLSIFPYGKGEMHFRGGYSEPNPEMAILTPLSTAVPIVVDGPFHVMGAALSPLGWAALTGLHAGEHRDHLVEANMLIGSLFDDLGRQLIGSYRGEEMTGRECALAIGDFIGRVAKPINARHVELVRVVNAWLGSSLNPELADLMDKAAYSERQVQRLTERYFGLPPQALARKYRALRAAALLSFPQLTPEFEAELGNAFFDQSHMIREITLFVGRTPSRLSDDQAPYLREMIDPKNFRELDI
ncbi:helix-turn-helix transcriptional regulator [Erythrobacter rubeus]|uniref:Helix-turn-helix domain-containing protein n=1 Tax=Erythrobacter rubeus TaxID=2760803 RepID=A0ABR8KT63_9SPHN|nr:helix-turn-helix domain-containing protein [Erythrobacter rubeus]MBD2843164.1 helix-turn-helix domain-containing protein [Erythrobacter rubeus]